MDELWSERVWEEADIGHDMLGGEAAAEASPRRSPPPVPAMPVAAKRNHLAVSAHSRSWSSLITQLDYNLGRGV
jgi:hypothetical protein